jgi:FkbM family methyltransferase
MSSTEARPGTIIYDRVSRTLSASGPWLRARTRLLQLAHRGLRPAGYLGVSRVFRIISSLAPTDAETIIREGAFRFCFPADDYYWNRLLDANWTYEPEIDAFLRAVRNRPFVFVDLGANFGYWSARVAAGMYGPRQALAVEPSRACHAVLFRNLDGFENVRAVRYAVSDRSGDTVRLFGNRHAGFSLDPTWPGASGVAADTVTTRTIDNLLAECGIDPAVTPAVIKVDVEGVEKQALDGAAAAIAGESLFLIEDASGADRVSDAIRHAHDYFGMNLYALERSGWRALFDLDDATRTKRGKSQIRQEGTNFIATRSAHWHGILRGVTHAG